MQVRLHYCGIDRLVILLQVFIYGKLIYYCFLISDGEKQTTGWCHMGQLFPSLFLKIHETSGVHLEVFSKG